MKALYKFKKDEKHQRQRQEHDILYGYSTSGMLYKIWSDVRRSAYIKRHIKKSMLLDSLDQPRNSPLRPFERAYGYAKVLKVRTNGRSSGGEIVAIVHNLYDLQEIIFKEISPSIKGGKLAAIDTRERITVLIIKHKFAKYFSYFINSTHAEG